MRLTALHVDGLRAADGVDLHDPSTLHALPDGPVGLALLDGIEMVAATCHPDRTVPALITLGIAADAASVELLDEDGLPVQVTVTDGDVGALIDADRSRTARVRASFELDPPLFGRLRQQAVRDPRLVTALSEATLSVTVGWIWTNDQTTASIGLLAVAVGGVAFPTTGSERPAWLPGLLHELAARIRRVPDLSEAQVASRLHRASLSPDSHLRGRVERLRRALAQPPFSLGTLELVQLGAQVRPCFGPSLLRARHLGPAALSALNLLTTVLLDQPDILLAVAPDAHLPPAELRAWLLACCEGDEAILEQVLIARGGAPS